MVRYKRLFNKFEIKFMLCNINWKTEKFHVIKRHKTLDYPYYQLFVPFRYKEYFGFFIQVNRVSIFDFKGPVVNKSIVRANLLEKPGYTPYCGKKSCKYKEPRTTFNGTQFICDCGWVSQFPKEFISLYKKKWDK